MATLANDVRWRCHQIHPANPHKAMAVTKLIVSGIHHVLLEGEGSGEPSGGAWGGADGRGNGGGGEGAKRTRTMGSVGRAGVAVIVMPSEAEAAEAVGIVA